MLKKKKKKKKNHTTLQHWNFDTTLECCNVVVLSNVVFSPTGNIVSHVMDFSMKKKSEVITKWSQQVRNNKEN